jgi:hypothetical protein
MSGTMILPGVYFDIRADALIAPGQITVGNLGVVGTASAGPVGVPMLLGTYSDALAIFGPYDAITGDKTTALTLVRALELAFNSGATTVYALRLADAEVNPDDTSKGGWAHLILKAGSDDVVTLTATSPGTWGNGIVATVAAPGAADILMTTLPSHALTGTEPVDKAITLTQPGIDSGRNQVSVKKAADGSVQVLTWAGQPTPPTLEKDTFSISADGTKLSFGTVFAVGDIVTAKYSLADGSFVKVSLKSGTTAETYLAVSGTKLAEAINDNRAGSTLVTANTDGTHGAELPAKTPPTSFDGGKNGEKSVPYGDASQYDPLLDVDAHIIVAAGQTDAAAGAALDAHCRKASNDVYKRDRIAVVGCDAIGGGMRPPLATVDKFVDGLIGSTLASDRVIFVAPGIVATSTAAEDEAFNPVTLSGAYTAAVIAGLLGATPPHVSLTNQSVPVAGLAVSFNVSQLTELVQNRVTALEVNRGIRVLRGQTTDTGAFREITTRRIVDYAKYGVRSAAEPFIGLLNNDRVRTSLRGSINSFLKGMLDDEMLTGFGIDVTATRDQQIAGIVQVTLTLQPVFSINFIKVTMVLS